MFHVDYGRGYNFSGREMHNLFNKYLLHNDAAITWTPYKHPQFGDIEIGGIKKNFLRQTVGFVLEEEAHRNMAWVMSIAGQLPKLVLSNSKVSALGGGLYQVDVEIVNDAYLPTRLTHDLNNDISLPDRFSLEGGKVLSGMEVLEADLNQTRPEPRASGETIYIDYLPGYGKKQLRWVVKGAPPYTLRLNSDKGGTKSREIK